MFGPITDLEDRAGAGVGFLLGENGSVVQGQWRVNIQFCLNCIMKQGNSRISFSILRWIMFPGSWNFIRVENFPYLDYLILYLYLAYVLRLYVLAA